MLTTDQIKALLAEGLHVYRGEPGTPTYRVVWLEDGASYTDGNARLNHAHPTDEAGEDWKQVDIHGFDPADYRLRSVNIHYGGHFHHAVCMADEPPTVTKVVKFANPEPPEKGHHRLPHYVIFTNPHITTDEQACEEAIDLILALHPGTFNGDNAHPVLVI